MSALPKVMAVSTEAASAAVKNTAAAKKTGAFKLRFFIKMCFFSIINHVLPDCFLSVFFKLRIKSVRNGFDPVLSARGTGIHFTEHDRDHPAVLYGIQT